jgi:hypothetical protein
MGELPAAAVLNQPVLQLLQRPMAIAERERENRTTFGEFLNSRRRSLQPAERGT